MFFDFYFGLQNSSGVRGETSGSGGELDNQYLTALNGLNSEYMGMGLSGAVLSNGVGAVGSLASPDLIKANIQQTGDGGFAAASGALSHPLNFDAQCDAYSNNAFNASSKEQRMTMLAKSRAKAQAEYEAKKKAKVEDVIAYAPYQKTWHVKNSPALGSKVADAMATGWTSNSKYSQTISIFGKSVFNGTRQYLVSSDKLNNAMTALITLTGLTYTGPDHGTGSTIRVSFIDNTGATKQYFHTFSGSANSQGVHDSFFQDISNNPPTFDMNGGSIRIDVDYSPDSPGRFDPCWNVGFSYDINAIYR